MSFLNALQAHRGGLIRIKTELRWRERGWDAVAGRTCLVLDAERARPVSASSWTASRYCGDACVLLLIDGTPHWVWVAVQDVEMLT